MSSLGIKFDEEREAIVKTSTGNIAVGNPIKYSSTAKQVQVSDSNADDIIGYATTAVTSPDGAKTVRYIPAKPGNIVPIILGATLSTPGVSIMQDPAAPTKFIATVDALDLSEDPENEAAYDSISSVKPRGILITTGVDTNLASMYLLGVDTKIAEERKAIVKTGTGNIAIGNPIKFSSTAGQVEIVTDANDIVSGYATSAVTSPNGAKTVTYKPAGAGVIVPVVLGATLSTPGASVMLDPAAPTKMIATVDALNISANPAAVDPSAPVLAVKPRGIILSTGVDTDLAAMLNLGVDIKPIEKRISIVKTGTGNIAIGNPLKWSTTNGQVEIVAAANDPVIGYATSAVTSPDGVKTVTYKPNTNGTIVPVVLGATLTAGVTVQLAAAAPTKVALISGATNPAISTNPSAADGFAYIRGVLLKGGDDTDLGYMYVNERGTPTLAS